MTAAQRYRKSLTKKWCMRFKTNHPDGDAYDGIVTHIKPRFIVLHEEKDFAFDGLVVLPKKNIKGFRDGAYERCFNEILRHSGAIKELRRVPWLRNADSIPRLIAALMQRDIWPAIETIDDARTDSSFYIGPITGVFADRFTIMHYDATGEWDAEYELEFREVFRIEFGSKYCEQFNAYMRRRGGS